MYHSLKVTFFKFPCGSLDLVFCYSVIKPGLLIEHIGGDSFQTSVETINFHSPLPLTNFSSLIHFPLLRSPIPPIYLVCERLSIPPIFVISLSLHRDTDTSMYIIPQSLDLSATINCLVLILFEVHGKNEFCRSIGPKECI